MAEKQWAASSSPSTKSQDSPPYTPPSMARTIVSSESSSTTSDSSVSTLTQLPRWSKPISSISVSAPVSPIKTRVARDRRRGTVASDERLTCQVSLLTLQLQQHRGNSENQRPTINRSQSAQTPSALTTPLTTPSKHYGKFATPSPPMRERTSKNLLPPRQSSLSSDVILRTPTRAIPTPTRSNKTTPQKIICCHPPRRNQDRRCPDSAPLAEVFPPSPHPASPSEYHSNLILEEGNTLSSSLSSPTTTTISSIQDFNENEHGEDQKQKPPSFLLSLHTKDKKRLRSQSSQFELRGPKTPSKNSSSRRSGERNDRSRSGKKSSPIGRSRTSSNKKKIQQRIIRTDCKETRFRLPPLHLESRDSSPSFSPSLDSPPFDPLHPTTNTSIHQKQSRFLFVHSLTDEPNLVRRKISFGGQNRGGHQQGQESGLRRLSSGKQLDSDSETEETEDEEKSMILRNATDGGDYEDENPSQPAAPSSFSTSPSSLHLGEPSTSLPSPLSAVSSTSRKGQKVKSQDDTFCQFDVEL